MSAQVAAFFDLDGTLLPRPSLERRFFRMLLYRREIPWKNYFFWLREALNLLPRGIRVVRQADKMYLSGVKSFDKSCTGKPSDSSVREGGHQEEGQARKPPKHNPRSPVLRFFEEGVERVACHAMLGHTIVIVSGTLEPLAMAAAHALEAEIAALGFSRKIRVYATQLEEGNGRWTGQILGEPMSGEAKARVVAAFAREMHLDLSRCWAYGDSAEDRSMLAAVGHPVAVNPESPLRRIARKKGWPILRTTNRLLKTQPLVPQTERCA